MALDCVSKENDEKGMACLLSHLTDEVELECFVIAVVMNK
jgi:hypothetical protein